MARCPECGGFFCRECVSEHAGRVVCAKCLAELVGAPTRRAAVKAWLTLTVPYAAAFLFVWLCFYGLGQVLLVLPDAFHSGEVWQGDIWDVE